MWTALSYLLTHMLKSLAIFVHFKWGVSLKFCPTLPEIFDLSIACIRGTCRLCFLYIKMLFFAIHLNGIIHRLVYIQYKEVAYIRPNVKPSVVPLFLLWLTSAFAFLEPPICCGVQCQTPRGHEWNHFTYAGSCAGTHDPQDTSEHGKKYWIY